MLPYVFPKGAGIWYKAQYCHYDYVLNAFLTEPWALILQSSLTTVKLFEGEFSYIVIEVVW